MLLHVALVLVALIGGTWGGGGQPVGAVTCDLMNPCFSIARWDIPSPSGTHGAKVTLRSNCMILPDTSFHYINHALHVQQSTSSWWSNAEIGIMIGGYPGGSLNNPWRYWEFWNASTNSFSLSSNSYTTNTGLTATIWKPDDGGDDWEMWFGNSTSHASAPNLGFSTSRSMWSGTYTSDNDARTYGSVSSMYFYNLGGAITPEWAGSTSSAYISKDDPPMDGSWAATDWWARMGIGPQC
jgi:hypothetical protein